ncbi:hypothetical protein DSO57_1032115 [Entomophthora muscae]|uniref:Uncharacterized protein n=1 Tax=Entomophthora muscae TaxID=34485 RepID=A0ACC2SPG3_9FUNG|nr:hypothetical protein DSO57_1032115 [Entomophthora muscae]
MGHAKEIILNDLPRGRPTDVKDINPNDLLRRLDSLNWSPWHTKLAGLLATGWAFDAFESSIVSAVMNKLKVHFEVKTSTEASAITFVWLLGALVGAISFGYLTDRFGRKMAFVVTILGYSIMTIITACSFNFYFFLVFRFLTAIGVGAEYVAVNATIAEFIPARHRGKTSTAVNGLWCVGALLANATQWLFLRYLDGSYSWRVGFALGGTAAIFVLYARRSLPESPRWLLVQGRYAEAEALVQSIEIMAGQPDNQYLLTKLENEVPFQAHSKYSMKRNLGEIFTKYPFRVAFGMVLNASQAFADYGESNLMSLGIFPDVYIVEDHVALVYLYGVLCTIPGFILVSLTVDVVGRKVLLPIFYTLAIIAVGCFIPAYMSKSVPLITAAHCFYQFSYTTASMTIYLSLSEAFPTHLRATGIGLSVAAGRIAAGASPFLVNHIFHNTGGEKVRASQEAMANVLRATGKVRETDLANIYGASGIIMAFFGAGLIMSLFWAAFGIEGKNRSLEDMNVDTATSKLE